MSRKGRAGSCMVVAAAALCMCFAAAGMMEDPLSGDKAGHQGTDLFPEEETETQISDSENAVILQQEDLPVMPRQVDLLIFAGQSNMAGNGDAADAPAVTEGSGWEFRAVTDPTTLYPIEEPFGIEENREDGIYDIWPDSGTRRKLGDLVPAFVNSYYETAQIPVVAVSASEGGTTVEQWLPETARYEDLKERTLSAKAYLGGAEEYELRNTYLIWCQGESDGDAGITEEGYYTALEELAEGLVGEGTIDACLVIRIGNFGGDAEKYDAVIAAQTSLCRDNPHMVLISTRFAEMVDTGLMRDVYHYTQEGYNLVGEEAGANAGYYANTQREPSLWDYEYGELYEP